MATPAERAPAAGPDPGAAPAPDALVFAEQVGLLHARSAVAQLTVVVNAALVTAIFWRHAPHAPALAWLASLCALAAARGAAARAYRSRPRAPGEAPAWARGFVVGAALNGVGWGLTAELFWVPGSAMHQLLLAFVLGGMTAGAASSNASHAPAFAAFAVPALAPMIVRLALERTPAHAAMAVMVALFGGAVAAISRQGGRAIADAIRLRFENEALVAHLTRSREQIEALNTVLERRVAERTAELERLLAERRRSEARLARFRALLDESGDAILVARAAGCAVVDVNAGACALLDRDADSLLGARLDALDLVPAVAGDRLRALVDALPPGGVRRLEDRRAVADRPPQELELTVAVQDLDGERFVLVSARDVSARKEMERKLTRAGLLASMGSLAAGVAHEINNPLAYVLSNLAELRTRLAGGAPPLQELVTESLEGAERVRRIVRDLWQLSPRADEAEVDAVDVHEVLESCIGVATNEIRHRATLRRDLAPVPPVRGDRMRLAQVFLNLLVNAAQSIPAGDAARQRITVRTRFDAGAGRVVIDVEDTGSGIPAALLDRVFEPFFTTKPSGRGMGLGLSICHGIVTTLGGALTVRSREREGSTFTVSLPAALGGARPVAGAPAGVEVEADDPAPWERDARLLVIDDDPGVARALRRSLLQPDVTIAIGGRAGLALLEREAFDAVVCDVMMPDVDGMDVHRRLRELRPGAEEAVVFVTGGAFTEAAGAFLDRVPNPRVAKPFAPAEVRAAVRRVLAPRRRPGNGRG